MNTKELNEIKLRYKGKGGGPEAESHVCDSKLDREDNIVRVYSTTADVAKILDRCGSAIVSLKDDGEGVAIEIDRSAFRGIAYAFKVLR
tara:strand:+ start:135 stop:401 length:267 start_codon:yes stop_codon:yes gene_type:complete